MHRFAVATASATFMLLLVGGVVRGTGSSLACPDWPLCFGHFFPTMSGGVLFEHSHRLMAAAVGLMTVGLAVAVWRRRRALRGFMAATLAALVVQAVLGGLNVILKLPAPVRAAHLAVSMLFLSMLVYTAWVTRAAPRAPVVIAGRRLVAVLGVAVYAQIVLGGLVAYTGGGMACLDEIPLCLGQVWGGLLPAAKAHMAHRLFAVVIAVGVVALAVQLLRSTKDRLVRRLALGATGIVLVQIGLGVLSVTSLLGVWQVRAHLGAAALLLGDLWLLWLATARQPEAAATAEAVAPITHGTLAETGPNR